MRASLAFPRLASSPAGYSVAETCWLHAFLTEPGNNQPVSLPVIRRHSSTCSTCRHVVCTHSWIVFNSSPAHVFEPLFWTGQLLDNFRLKERAIFSWINIYCRSTSSSSRGVVFSSTESVVKYLVYRPPTIAAIMFNWITMKAVQQLTGLTQADPMDSPNRPLAVKHAPGHSFTTDPRVTVNTRISFPHL